MQLALIAVGRAAGALLRYGVGRAVHLEAFPAATLTVNVTGSFAIASWRRSSSSAPGMPAELRTALLVGLLGSYTTFSTFSLETLRLAQDGEWTYVALNVVLSVTGALVAVWAGQTLARQ